MLAEIREAGIDFVIFVVKIKISISLELIEVSYQKENNMTNQ